jgi:N-methylhydantoinase B
MAVTPVPGSEFYASRPLPEAELRQRISPVVKLHTISPTEVAAVDPLTYEVVRHRLWSITDEMGEALKRMSGSIVVSDCNDFDFAITDEVGQEVQIGLYNTALAASLDLAISWTLQNWAENPGICEGDMFLCNDPWVGGAMHQNDVSLFSPIFWEGELFAWTSAVCHQLDLGGVAPGSWTPRSQDVFWESLPTPPVKIVRNFELQRDVEAVYLRRSRMPQLVGLDLRAKMGANMIAQERIHSLIERYGPTSVKAVMKRAMDDAERRLRAKLSSLPDGTWRAASYQEQSSTGDREVHRIVVAMTKKDDHLTFDFRGTDPQSGMINCTYSGMRGGIVSMLLPILAGDIPWAAGGLMRCFDIISDEGTLNNATFPAGICKASVSSTWATANVVTECMSKMLDTTPDARDRAISVCCGTWDLAVLAGLDQRNQPFVTMLMEPMAAGFGAKVDRDGVDTGGLLSIPMGRAPDAEINEFTTPILYLWRREEPDSGGPGKFRGGVSGSICIIPYGTSAPMSTVSSGSGKAVPMNLGLAGGYPGNTQLDIVIRNADVAGLMKAGQIPQSLDEISGQQDVLASEIETTLNPIDVYFMHWQAGGGYGDPLHRDPSLVAADVREFKVIPKTACDIYGVVFEAGSGEVDLLATERRRDEIRAERRSRSSVPAGTGWRGEPS